jgi:hypothetical protein
MCLPFVRTCIFSTVIILPVIVYGRETCSLTLREEHRLRVFENREQGAQGNMWTEEG